MLDVEDFDAVFQGIKYSDGIVQQILEYKHALNNKLFFERLLDLLRIKGRNIYPPKTNQQLEDLHQRIVTSETTLHNKHCLIFYLLKDLSPQQYDDTELATKFAQEVHLEKRFWTFIEGLWALDHLELRTAVEHLTHPSIIPTFPDEILFTLLMAKERLSSVGTQAGPEDDILPLAYYNCVKPPLDDQSTRTEFIKYLSARNVTEAYYWIHTRPEHEQKQLLEIFIESTLDRNNWSNNPDEIAYTRDAKAIEFVSLPFTQEEDEYIERFLTEGKGRIFLGAHDTVLMRRIAMGRLADVAAEQDTRSRKHDGLTWELLKDGVRKGLGPRKFEERFMA